MGDTIFWVPERAFTGINGDPWKVAKYCVSDKSEAAGSDDGWPNGCSFYSLVNVPRRDNSSILALGYLNIRRLSLANPDGNGSVNDRTEVGQMRKGRTLRGTCVSYYKKRTLFVRLR